MIGLIDPCSRWEDFTRSIFTRCCNRGLTLTVVFKRGIISNLPLDFKQFSFTHITRSWGCHFGKRFPSSPLFRRAIFPFRFPFSVNRMTSQVVFLDLWYITYNHSCRHAAHKTLYIAKIRIGKLMRTKELVASFGRGGYPVTSDGLFTPYKIAYLIFNANQNLTETCVITFYILA